MMVQPRTGLIIPRSRIFDSIGVGPPKALASGPLPPCGGETERAVTPEDSASARVRGQVVYPSPSPSPSPSPTRGEGTSEHRPSKPNRPENGQNFARLVSGLIARHSPTRSALPNDRSRHPRRAKRGKGIQWPFNGLRGRWIPFPSALLRPGMTAECVSIGRDNRSQRMTRAPLPFMIASTSLTLTIEVSPGVVMARAPWAAPYSTAACGPLSIRKP